MEMITNKEVLLVDLSNDLTARDRILAENKKLEQEVKKLEKELQRLQKEDPKNDKINHVETQTYRKFMEQRKVKESLKKQLILDRERLRMMIEVVRRFSDAKTDITEMNVETLSQSELIRTVKQLERRKVDALSKLNEIGNRLDSTSLEISKLKDAVKMYKTEVDLKQRKQSHSRLQKHRI